MSSGENIENVGLNSYRILKIEEKTVGRVVAEIDMGAGGSTLFLGFTIGYLEFSTNSLPQNRFLYRSFDLL